MFDKCLVKELEALNNKDEMLLLDSHDRKSLLPIIYPDLYQKYKEHQAVNWTFEELDMTEDKKTYEMLPMEEKNILNHMLKYFTEIEHVINVDFLTILSSKIKLYEVKLFYDFQIMIENIHAETYGNMVYALINNEYDRETLLFNDFPAILHKSNFLTRLMRYVKIDDIPINFLIFIITVLEGIQLSGNFVIVQWIVGKYPGLHGLAKANEFIRRDEKFHFLFSAYLTKTYIKNKLSTKLVHKIISLFVEIEYQYFSDMFTKFKLYGLTLNQMDIYLKHMGNLVLKECGYPAMYESTFNPFPFMDKMNFITKTNFFESRATEYQNISASTINDNVDDSWFS